MSLNTIIMIVGVLLLLLAPMFGLNLANFYLRLLEGMETEKFLVIIKGCIGSIQILSALLIAYGLFSKNNKE